MSYNGWKNRNTWNIALWLGNDEGLYRSVRDERRRLSLMGHRKFNATRAKQVVLELLPNGTPDMDSNKDYRGVDWSAISRCLNEF